MKRPALVVVLASLALAGTARGDGLPVLGIDVGPSGVVAPSGEERFVTLPAGDDTVLARVGTSDGRVARSSLLRGTLTIPAVAYDGSAGGLSGDGLTLVLIEPRERFPRTQTRLAVLDTRRLGSPRSIALRGDFSYDALSPGGRLLYLIQYVAPNDPTRYDVRAFDVRAGRLLAGAVVDPTEPDEEMRGHPLSRVASDGGRWAYTLYGGAGGAPFVHALDTARRTARCIDLDDLAAVDAWKLRLRLDDGGRTVSVVRRGRPLVAVDTRTFAVGEPATAAPASSSSTWPALVAASAGAVALAVAGGLLLLRRRR